MNKYWFKPRGFGYGATPTTWEGWVLVLLFMAYFLLIAYVIAPEEGFWQVFYVVLGIVIMLLISKSKTDGDWHWNWGRG